MTRAIAASEKYVVQYYHPYIHTWVDVISDPSDTMEQADVVYRNNESINAARKAGVRYRIIFRQIYETDLVYDEVEDGTG
jgi:hypothetical protein